MKTNATTNEYDQQATDFLTHNGLKMRITLSNSKTAPWDDDGEDRNHYRITISRDGWKPDRRKSWEKVGQGEHLTTLHATDLHPSRNRLVFDFWGSIADAQAGKTEERPYSVLACISGDAYTPETFADFCAEYGYEADSIKALQQFRRCDRFAKRLRAFFTAAELEELSEIR